jgi:DNA-binding NtrC family response regulator
MMRHDWPGNVRELENSWSGPAPVFRTGAAPGRPAHAVAAAGAGGRRRHAATGKPAGEAAAPGVKTLADLEREAILGAIRTLNGDKLQAAKLLGIGKTTLYRKLKEYGIADPLHED